MEFYVWRGLAAYQDEEARRQGMSGMNVQLVSAHKKQGVFRLSLCTQLNVPATSINSDSSVSLWASARLQSRAHVRIRLSSLGLLYVLQ